MRESIIFRCSVCGNENYVRDKNKRKQPDRLEISKFCPTCNKKTAHKEKK